MIRKACALLAAAALCAGTMAVAQTAAPKTAAPKTAAPKTAAPKAPAAKAPAAKAAPARTAAFDARDPASLVALLTELDAKASVAGKSQDGVLVTVTSPAGSFQSQFAGCNPQGRTCAAVQFEAPAVQRTATLAEINGFNQASLTCRIFQDKAGKPHMLYSTLLFAGDTREEMLGQISAWQGCLANFGAFLADPPGYLASAP
jgi:hypothetical protein